MTKQEITNNKKRRESAKEVRESALTKIAKYKIKIEMLEKIIVETYIYEN